MILNLSCAYFSEVSSQVWLGFFFNDLCSTCMSLQTQHPVWQLCILVARSKLLKDQQKSWIFYVCPVHMIFPTVVMHSPKHRKGYADLFNKSYLEDLDVSYQPWNFSLEPSITILQKNTPLLRSTRPPKLPSTNRLPVIADNCPACFAAPKERHRDLAFWGDSTTNPILLMGQLNIRLRMIFFEPTNPFRKKNLRKIPSYNRLFIKLVSQGRVIKMGFRSASS